MPLCISCRGEYWVPPEKFREIGPQTSSDRKLPWPEQMKETESRTMTTSKPISGYLGLSYVYNQLELPPYVCARCGQSNERWHEWTSANIFAHFSRFFFYSTPWGWLALLSFTLPILAYLFIDFTPVASVPIGIPLAMILIFVNVALLYALKDSLWRYDLVARVGRAFLPQLALLAIITFVIAVVFGLIIAFMLESRLPPSEVKPITGLGQVITTIMLPMIFVNVTLSAMFMAGHDYCNWMNRQMPQPIYAQERRLLGVIEDDLQAKIRQTIGKESRVETSLNGLERTTYAGIILMVNTETEFKPESSKDSLKQLQNWRIIADRWGRIQKMEADGAPRYSMIEKKHTETNKDEKPANSKIELAKEGELILGEERLKSQSAMTVSVTSSRQHWTS